MKHYKDFIETSPCTNCAAHCCKMLLIPYDAPKTFMQMDYVKFTLGFPSTKILLNRNGGWQVKIEQNCRFFDEERNKCKVYGDQSQPKTCTFYNPYNCWYKKNFSTEEKTDFIEFDLQMFQKLFNILEFSDDGTITSIPNFEEIYNLINA
jgi:Fe-S-cluster containining protein